MKASTAFYEGVVSSFFVQPLKHEYRTSHHIHNSIKLGTNHDDWLKISKDFNNATDKVLCELDSNQRKHLRKVRHKYVSQTT